MRKAHVVALAVVLSVAVTSPAFAAGDPAPGLHGEVSKPLVSTPAPVPSPPIKTPAPVPTPPPVVTAPPSAAPSSPAPSPAPVVDEPAQRALEVSYAKGDSVATDMRGIKESLYKGKWFNAKDEDTRRCIVRKETGGNYESVSSGGDYRGAYQMSRALAIGATWMMQSEVRKELGEEPAALVPALRNAPTQTWNRYWQDRAFWTIWRNGAGASHWRSIGC
ncbi:MAG: hypothetical protein Q7K25_03790 [Actinomycetota bacterium]|nr:hypothetical protein [Actinomycetota bacterium]